MPVNDKTLASCQYRNIKREWIHCSQIPLTNVKEEIIQPNLQESAKQELAEMQLLKLAEEDNEGEEGSLFFWLNHLQKVMLEKKRERVKHGASSNKLSKFPQLSNVGEHVARELTQNSSAGSDEEDVRQKSHMTNRLQNIALRSNEANGSYSLPSLKLPKQIHSHRVSRHPNHLLFHPNQPVIKRRSTRLTPHKTHGRNTQNYSGTSGNSRSKSNSDAT